MGAKQYAEALQKFNAKMEALYSEMEDDMEKNASSDHKLVTAGGALAADDLPGLPANTLDYQYSKPENAENSGSPVSPHQAQPGLDKKVVAASVAALPRYRSVQDVAKANEPERKVAKALFDYPGGYRSNELTFHRGTSLIITKEKEGWVYGHYELEPSLTGWFPKSYVKIITGTT